MSGWQKSNQDQSDPVSLGSQIEEIVGAIAALDSKLQESAYQPAPSQPAFSQDYPGYWQCYILGTGSSGTLSSGTDWESEFTDGAATITYHRLPTASGELYYGRGSGNIARYARLAFDSPHDFTTYAYLRCSAYGRVQIKLNGVLIEKTADDRFQISLKAGRNVIGIGCNNSVGDVAFYTTLFTGVTSKFYDPDGAAKNAIGSGSADTSSSDSGTDLGA